jgi:PAS domain S-box-containing protein
MDEIDKLYEQLAQYQQREKDLELKLEELSDFIENASLPLHWVNADGIIVWANQAELVALGYTKEEYVGHPIQKFHADEDVIADILLKLTNNKTLHNYPAKLKCKDGSIKYVLINSNVFRKDGKFIHTRCFTRDITAFVKEGEKKASLLVELEQSEARLRMAIEATKLGTWEYNPISGALNWSEECKKIYGIGFNEEVNFGLFAEHIYADDRECVESEIQNAMNPAGNGTYDISYRIVRFDDGSVRWIRAQGKVYLNISGQAERFIGTVIDITDNKLAFEKSAKLAAIVESSDDAIISKTLDGIITSWNSAAERIFGYKAEEIIGKPILILIPPDRLDEEPLILSRLKKGERVEHFETQRVTKDKRLLEISLTISPVRDQSGNIIGVSKIARDITESKQAAKLITEREEHLGLAIKAADLGTFDMNLVKGTLVWDRRCRELFGIYNEHAVTYNEDFLNGLHEDDRERVSKLIEDVLDKNKGNGNYDVEYRTIGAQDKKLRWLRAMGKAFFDEKGRPVRFIGTALDITDRKHEELRKNDFIAMVSHELKTPLTSITAYVEVLLEKAQKEENGFAINALNRTRIQAKKMASMIQDFLSLARLEEGKIQISKELFELHPLMEEVVGEAQYLTSNHTIKFEDCEGIIVNADRDKIGQILINLLSNAIKYSPKGGLITIGCEKKGKQVKVFVSDQGIGINLHDQKKLFNRFYRVKNDKIKTVSGFGIGLYLVSEILRYHNSKIEVESKEGVGSTFYFTLISS